MKQLRSSLPVCMFAVLGGSSLCLGAQEPQPVQWFEAEHYIEQRGSGASKFEMLNASGGACVDNDWGGKEGDFLRYKLELTSSVPALHITLNYAREPAADSVVRVTLDGDTNKSALVKLCSTGDWGFKPEGWRWAAVQLPACGKGAHTLEVRSLANNNNVNLDGFYLSAEPLDTTLASLEPPSGPEAIEPIGKGLSPLPCKTPVALPYSRRKAFVAGNGLLQSLLSTPAARGMGGNIAGPALQVKLAGHGPWTSVEQAVVHSPVPTILTRLKWPEVEVEQTVFAAAPEEQGFFMRVTVTNIAAAAHEFELISLVRNAGAMEFADGQNLPAQGQPLLRPLPAPGVSVSDPNSALPGPLGSGRQLRHSLKLARGASASFDLQFLGDALSYDEAQAASARVWREKLAPSIPLHLPNPKLQYAFDASLRQMLMLIEARPDHARVLKGLQNYYGANPYDTFQVSRALDALGLKTDAEELLRHQIQHQKDDGIFEMWENGDLQKPGAEQWIVQGLAATALWNHYQAWHDDAWLREIAPTLIKAAQATLRARRAHAGVHQQGAVAVEGWLPPIGGDGGLGVGYHWSQNAGPLNGLRIASEAADKLRLPEAGELRAGWLTFQQAFDKARAQATLADPEGMLPSFPGATGSECTRPLWGVVMCVSAFDAIPPDDPAALRTLRFLQTNLYGGLHLNLGYSRGVWPYLSAEVALWHLRLGETGEAWRILHAIVNRASSTVCWYEEIEQSPPRGHGDPADVWAAAETVYLARQLLLA
ncbi:MAG: hypothetical protein NT154_29570, partial [Verrucomicrobia bacterium]|nr:hypothetical protein [Verrucomicrobiota bacterium]